MYNLNAIKILVIIAKFDMAYQLINVKYFKKRRKFENFTKHVCALYTICSIQHINKIRLVVRNDCYEWKENSVYGSSIS